MLTYHQILINIVHILHHNNIIKTYVCIVSIKHQSIGPFFPDKQTLCLEEVDAQPTNAVMKVPRIAGIRETPERLLWLFKSKGDKRKKYG